MFPSLVCAIGLFILKQYAGISFQSFDMFLAFPPFRRLLCGSEEIYMKKPVALPGIKHVAAEGIVPSGGQHYGKETGNSEKKIYSRDITGSREPAKAMVLRLRREIVVESEPFVSA